MSAKLRHGQAGLDAEHRSEYLAWRNMRRRCYCPKDPAFHNYGGRGIRVCEQWLDDFAQFLKDAGPKPSADHTLDRINNDGNYEPGNVRWATEKTQSRNRRTNAKVTWRGESLPLSEWAERLGVKDDTLRRRLLRWPLEQAMTVPVGSAEPKGRMLTAHGKTMLISAWAREFGIRPRLIYTRLERGYTDHEAICGESSVADGLCSGKKTVDLHEQWPR